MNPPILPGCLVIHIDAFGRWKTATVIQFVTHDSHYEATVIQDCRILPLILNRENKDGAWRVLLRES